MKTQKRKKVMPDGNKGDCKRPSSVPKASNPFSTRFITPGKIPFIFGANSEIGIEQVVRSFREHGFVGQIVGPHGTGKTALTFDVERQLGQHFESVRRLTIRSIGEIKFDVECLSSVRDMKKRLLIIDGIERLPWIHRQLLLRHCTSRVYRNSESGLLLTTHKPIRSIPILFQTESSLELFATIAQRYLGDDHELSVEAIESGFDSHQPNLREGLMSLYDNYETGQLDST